MTLNLSFDFRVGGILFIYDCCYVYFILHVLSVVVSLIGGVPRMGPRVPFALLPFRHYPIKYLKQNKTLPVLPLLNGSINYRLIYYRVIITPQTGVLLQKRVKMQVAIFL